MSRGNIHRVRPQKYSFMDSSFGRQNRIGHARVASRTRLSPWAST